MTENGSLVDELKALLADQQARTEHCGPCVVGDGAECPEHGLAARTCFLLKQTISCLLSAQQETAGWQPVSTAPMSEPVLVWIKENHIVSAFFAPGPGWIVCLTGRPCKPRCWMPIPGLPERP